MCEDIKEIRSDVKSLLQFRVRIMAGAGVIGAIISAIVFAVPYLF
jgi:hypothetical protein